MDRATEIRDRLFGLSARGIKYDLGRMKAAAEACGSPQRSCACFHVAGTNGKGSVCAFLESALRSCGMRTGLFMSPHLVHFEERFIVDGHPVGEAEWLDVYYRLQPVIEAHRLTFFEATTLMAFELFKCRRVEWAVYETGLGGRHDATNVVLPAVSVITRLAMDHTEFLGNSLAAIADEKLGIVKPGVPLIMARPDDGPVGERALRRCAEAGSTCTFVDGCDAAGPLIDAGGARFRWEGTDFRINLRGDYQFLNALCALAAVRAAGFGDLRRIAGGLGSARLPGRFQTVSVRGRSVVFDVGHNPDAAAAFCGALKREPRAGGTCMVIGIMKDKDIAGMLPHYADVAQRIIFTRPATARAADPETMRAQVPPRFKGGCHVGGTVASALEMAFDAPEASVCVIGSFFTVGEAMTHLGIAPYGTDCPAVLR